MTARTWSLFAVLLLAGAALSGCTSPSEGDAPAAEANPPASNPPPASDGGSGSSGSSAPAPKPVMKPTVDPVQDQGKIEGHFEKSWDVVVPTQGLKATTVEFALKGIQEGAPATARVHFAFLDPEGNTLKSAIVGMGGADGDLITWEFSAADMPMPGTYKLQATAQPQEGSPAGVPSFGLASYDLYALVQY